MDVKLILSITFSLSLLLESFCQYEYEDELYKCIKSELATKGRDLEKGLDLFEKQLIEIGYLSEATSLYDAFRIQSHCSSPPLIIKKYIDEIDVRVNRYFEIRTYCYEQDNKYKKESKYAKMLKKMESRTDEMYADDIWKLIHTVLEEKDYQHPFYRMKALVTLHSWSIDAYDKYGSENSCFDID